ncbi:hypothetical protein [Pseudaminobacter sp. NGMCC 1.201702]|uniref:hypothetical protein n=1 Tax=Pseudaminobacter sp. NGMCC 1.201702 TaxID=3391825 RepID=UPI0039F0A390
MTVTRSFGRERLPDLSNVTDGMFVFDVEQFVAGVSPVDPGLASFVGRASVVVLHDASLLDIPPFAAVFHAMDKTGGLRVVGICPTDKEGLQAIGRSAFLTLFGTSVAIRAGSPVRALFEANEVDAPDSTENLSAAKTDGGINRQLSPPAQLHVPKRRRRFTRLGSVNVCY